MKVKGLDGREYNWNVANYDVSKDDKRRRSDLHLRCRDILNQVFVLDTVCEEVPLPGTKLTFDFYLPQRQVAIECQGEQHYKYIPHFHGSRMGFLNSRRRDMDKRDWCDINGISLIELPFSETDDEWRKRITGE